MTVAEKLRRHQEKLRGIQRAVRPDKPLVTVTIRHVVRGQKHNVVPGCVQMTVSSVNDARLRQRNAAFGAEVGDYKFMDVRLLRLVFGRILRRSISSG